MRPSWPTRAASLPVRPVASALLLANAAAFLAGGSAGSPGFELLALVPAELGARPWAVFSYAFVHAGAWSLAIDLVALCLAAPPLERAAGGRAVLGWNAAGALLASPLAFLSPGAPLAGSTGAVLGVLAGAARRRPETEAIDAGQPDATGARPWWLALGLVALAAAVGLAGPDGAAARIGVAVAALLVGLARGRPRRPAPVRRVELPNSHYDAPGVVAPVLRSRWDAIDLDALHEVNREAVAGVLDKARAGGQLTPGEREFLDRMGEVSRLNRQWRGRS